MKRILSVIIMLAILCSFTANCFAQEKEDVFYTQPDEELIKAIDDLEKMMAENDKIYVEKFILEDGEQYDPEKMVHDRSKLYKFKWWTLEELEDLITSDDIKAKIRDFEPTYYIFPCYYNGELLNSYREVFGQHETTVQDFDGNDVVVSVYRVDSYGENDTVDCADINYTIKEDVEEYMENAGIVGYDVVYALHSTGLRFAIVEKDNEIFIIPLLKDNIKVHKGIIELCKREKELIDKQVLTVEETCYIIDEYRKIASEIKTGLDGNLQNELSDNSQSGTDEKTDFPWEYVGIGVGAAVLIAAIVLLIVFKKKKV